MKTLESLFQRFGSPAEEMNERINIYGMRADCIKDMKHIRSEDERARRTISEMLEYIETLKEYRKTLFDRAQEICAASYRLQIKNPFSAYLGGLFFINHPFNPERTGGGFVIYPLSRAASPWRPFSRR